MQISDFEAVVLIQTFTNSNPFITKELLKILATSADELEFPFPYENIRMSPTSRRDSFLLYLNNDSSRKGDLTLEKLVKETICKHEVNHPFFV